MTLSISVYIKLLVRASTGKSTSFLKFTQIILISLPLFAKYGHAKIIFQMIDRDISLISITYKTCFNSVELF